MHRTRGRHRRTQPAATHRKAQPTARRLIAMVACLIVAALTYLATLTVRGAGPAVTDLQVAFTAGPLVLILTICIGAQAWRIEAARAAVQVLVP